ncbi:hypothetical protein [Clostridium neonatale]|nr:hypothetical protein [Clostridium neonatale]MBP8314779.1 hypothetical protein [Clostridium neonatale]CAI3601687.1 Conserved hypothetical protein [Clostridium neonatale]CAI3621540.1 Conserved hypothetical protein [Clostridium neonatale]CAI3646272.1 Conserved hypothetical protein [Clostridium neonatale]CAI4139733.1 Conserved hypothetical protein [Clostridium neonatale]
MRYIGPFFRMNSLSQKEISGQLFYLSKESVKTLVLNSKCGLIIPPVRTSKKSSINDISTLNNFSPLLCLYRKASPMFIHNKTSHGFDESTFKKEISPTTNALMTLCLLELSKYYSHFTEGNRNINSLENAYKYLAKEQLQFYSEHLRNAEGLFVPKKNISDGNSKGYELVDKDNKFKFSDQAFMMDAYLLYSIYNPSDDACEDYKIFSYEILQVFKEYKDSLYDLSFTESIEIFLALNVFYKYSNSLIARELILDLGDYLVNKFQEKDYYIDSLDDCALFAICLMEAYKHTDIISFKETAKEINEKLLSLYDNDKNIFLKISDKKDIKYSCTEINFYLISLILYSEETDKTNDLKPIVSGIFKRFYVNGGLLSSWPEAPTLDEVERYKRLSLRVDDMMDESYFRMSVLPTPKSTGLAPIFVKNLEYSKKKDNLSKGRVTFDSNKNMTNFFLIIYLFRNSVEDTMELNLPLEEQEGLNNSLRNSSSSGSKNANLDNNEPSDIESEISEIKSNDSVIDTTSELENISNNSEPQITLNGLSENKASSSEHPNLSKNKKSKKR